MNKAVLFIFFLFLLAAFAFQNSKTETKPLLVGQFYASDTTISRAYCKGHTLTLKADSTFTFYSMCLNSEGKWKYKNGKIVLNSIPLGDGTPPPNVYKPDGYDKEKIENDIRVKVIGKNKKPIVCEEIKCVAGDTTFTKFTDKDGCVHFPVEKYDTIYFVSLSCYYSHLWKKYPDYDKIKPSFFLAVPHSHNWGSFTLHFSVNNEYQHYAFFSNLEFTINKESMLVPNTSKQNQTVKTDLPEIPFGKKMKKK